MTHQRLLLAALSAVWMSMVIACGGGGAGNHETELKTERVGTKTKAAHKDDKEEKAKAAPEAVTKNSPPRSEAHPPSVKLIPIKSYPIEDAWRQANKLKGQRVRLKGEAELKRSIHGVYAVFKSATGRPIAVVSVKNDDAQPLLHIKVGESQRMSVNLETTVKGISDGWYLTLADSEFLRLDAAEGFVSMEEQIFEVERATAAKDASLPPKPDKSPATDPAPIPKGSSGNSPTRVSTSSPVYLGTSSKPVYVRGYYKKDGTYVRSHSRAAPGTGAHRRR